MKTLFLFFMDLGRLLCAPLLLVFRVRRMHLDGSPAHTLPKGGAVLVCNGKLQKLCVMSRNRK